MAIPAPAYQRNEMDTERRVLELLGQSWNEMMKLAPQHPEERDDFRRALHECQRIVAFRIAQRCSPDLLR